MADQSAEINRLKSFIKPNSDDLQLKREISFKTSELAKITEVSQKFER